MFVICDLSVQVFEILDPFERNPHISQFTNAVVSQRLASSKANPWPRRTGLFFEHWDLALVLRGSALAPAGSDDR